MLLSITMKPLKRAIADFEKAQKALDAMEKSLNKSVGIELKKIGVDFEDMVEDHIHEIQGLIEKLPIKYGGTRRLYELIYRIQDKN